MKRLIRLLTLTLFTLLFLFKIPNGSAVAATLGDYEYEVLPNGTIMITDYTGYQAVLKIPSTLEGKTVTSLGPNSFENAIGATNIVIPKEITSISNEAFSFCEQLTNITVSSENTAYISIDGVLFSKDMQKLLCYPTAKTLSTYIIPEAVTNIDGAFAGNNYLISIILSSKLKKIGPNTFNRCSKLINIDIPYGVLEIGDSAFANCSALMNITIPASVTSIASDAFEKCYSIVFFQVASSNSYFSSENGILFNASKTTLLRCPPHSGMANYTIPESVRTIAEGAFEACRIPVINVGTKVSTIAENAFINAFLLEQIVVHVENPYFCSIDGILYNKDLTKIYCCPKGKSVVIYTLPDTVTTIGDYAFYSCDDLMTVNIPSYVQTIGSNSFMYCNSLAITTVPYTVTNIGKNAFFNCFSIKLRCVENSAAYCYAIDNKLPYELYTDASMPVLALSATDVNLYTAGPTQTISLSGLSGNMITWSSSDDKVVTVIEGILTPRAKGSATITAFYKGFRFTCKVTVNQSEINKTKLNLKVGKTFTLSITGSTNNIIWKSSNTSIAKVSKSGVVTAKKAGKVIITAYINGVEYRCEVTVKK